MEEEEELLSVVCGVLAELVRVPRLAHSASVHASALGTIHFMLWTDENVLISLKPPASTHASHPEQLEFLKTKHMKPSEDRDEPNCENSGLINKQLFKTSEELLHVPP